MAKPPRKTKPTTTPRPQLPKSPTGIQGLDEITDGGLPTGRPTLVCGDAGCGKTLLAMEFLVRGATDFDEPGVFMTFEESAQELTDNVASIGFDLPSLIRRKKLILDYVHLERSEIAETGEFNLEGIAPAARGTPQIEVSFDIDANGILHVGAKDKATGKENKITIKANSGLSEEEIQQMVKDAELNAVEDKKKLEIVQSRNQADAAVHSVKKSLTEHGDKLDAGEKEKIEAAVKEVEDALKGEDKAEIDAKTEALMTVSQKLGEKVYADMQAQQAAAAGGAPGAANENAKPADDNVVDAEVKEVKKG